MTFGGKVCLFKLKKGSKIDLLSKIWIFFENRQKIGFFKALARKEKKWIFGVSGAVDISSFEIIYNSVTSK